MRFLRTTLLIVTALFSSIPLAKVAHAQATTEDGTGYGMGGGIAPGSQEFLIFEGPGDTEPQKKKLWIGSLKIFRYPLGSLKPVELNQHRQGNASEATAMGDSRQAPDPAAPTIEIYAAVMDGSRELLVPLQQAFPPLRATGAGGYGSMMGGGEMMGGGMMGGGYGEMMGGMGGMEGYGGEMMGGMDGGEMGGYSGMGGMGGVIHTRLVRLQSLSRPTGAADSDLTPAPLRPTDSSSRPTGAAEVDTQSKVSPLQLPPKEVELVSRIILQSVRRRQLLEQLDRFLGDPAAVEQLEVALKKLLIDEYETQLERQELEITRIEQRTRELREELKRRREAKERVVDVQLGRIVLDAQGLLDR